jgi:ParB family chromosome partitioning protein
MPDDGKSRLGRGLAALIGDVGAETQAHERGRTQRRVPVEFLSANPRNPRRSFPDGELDELAASLRERGIIQPIVVRPVRGKADAYEIVAGERRWRAAQRAGLHDVPIVAIEASDREALEIAIVENVQRADLNPLEEATGYQSLIDFGHSQEAISKVVGKSRSHVANTLRLLKLPEVVKAYIRAGKLSAGHARSLIGEENPEQVAREIVERGLNVRDAEAIAKERKRAAGKGGRKSKPAKDADTRALERRVTDKLGMTVSINHGRKGGTVQVKYRDLDQLDEVVRRLARG